MPRRAERVNLPISRSPWSHCRRRRCGPTSRCLPSARRNGLRPSYAVGAEVQAPSCWTALADPSTTSPPTLPVRRSAASSLLYDPEGTRPGVARSAWWLYPSRHGSRLGHRPMLPEVAWSWLTDALGVPEGQIPLPPTPTRPHLCSPLWAAPSPRRLRSATATSPAARAHQLEVARLLDRTRPALAPHLEAFCDVLAAAAGLPPTGVTWLKSTD